MQHNLRNHEIAGLSLVFIGATSIGIGLYYIVMNALRSRGVFGKEIIIFPILFGLGVLIFELGKIELKDVEPGKHQPHKRKK